MPVPWALFDVDTRERFGGPDGPTFRKRAERIRTEVERLVEAAGRHGAPIVASTCVNPACVPMAGDLGPKGVWIPQDEGERGWEEHLQRSGLVLLEKRTAGSVEANRCQRAWEVFSRNPNARRVVQDLEAAEWGVFGHSAENCVTSTVRGLMQLGCSVTLLSDALVSSTCDAEVVRQVLEEMRAEGAGVETVDEFLRRQDAARLAREGDVLA